MSRKSARVCFRRPLSRVVKWGVAILAIALLGMCSMWEVPVWLVLCLGVLPTVVLWWPIRSIHKAVVAASLALAASTLVMWGQGACANVSWHYRWGPHRLCIEPMAGFVYLSYAYPTSVGNPPRWRWPLALTWPVCSSQVATCPDGSTWLVHGAFVPPWFPTVPFLVYPLVALAVGLLGAPRRHQCRGSSCLKCGYDLRGNVGGRCPECGDKVRQEVAAPVAKEYRKERFSVAVSLAGAAIVFPFLLAVAWFSLGGVLIVLIDSLFWFWRLSDNAVFGVLTAVTVVLAYVPSRMIFMSLRWRTVQRGGRYCADCGYDLTGNVSGRCSECGEAI